MSDYAQAGRATRTDVRSPVVSRRSWRFHGPDLSAMSASKCIHYAVLWQTTSFALMAAQLVLVCVLGWYALLPGLVGLALLYASMPLAGATVFLQILLYQNWFLSLFSSWNIDQATFQAVQGWAFGAITSMAGIAILRPLPTGQARTPAVKLTRLICLTLVVVLAYTAYGAVGSSAVSAMTYLRNTSAMLLALIVGLDIGRAWQYRTFAIIFVVSVAFGLILGTFELLLPYTYFEVSNAVAFWNLKFSSTGRIDLIRTIDDLVRARYVTWFNITGGSGDHMSIRVSGPNMHPISFAYVIGVTGIVAASLRLPIVATALIGVLLMAGIKGPLLMLAVTMGLYTLWTATGHKTLLLVTATTIIVAYVGLGIWIGMSNGDFHVIGFLGGLRGFMAVPLGHGIGVGGNLSALAVAGLDWQEWQGAGADFALESAVGVLLYQMGIGAIAVYMPLAVLVRQGFGRSHLHQATRSKVRGPAALDALFIGIAAILVNGIFQEEAYSPYALGLLSMLGGTAVANTKPIMRMSKSNPYEA